MLDNFVTVEIAQYLYGYLIIRLTPTANIYSLGSTLVRKTSLPAVSTHLDDLYIGSSAMSR